MTMYDAVYKVNKAMELPERLEPGEYIEMVKLAYRLLNKAAEGPDVSEYYSEVKLSPIALGQVLMEHTNPDGKVAKHLWLEVAEHIGPDFAQGFYHAAVFTTKVA